MSEHKNLTAVNIRYLLVISELDRENSGARISDIARRLGVAKSSVHTMVKRFCEKGLVSKEKYDTVHMSENGERLAEKYSDCFALLYGRLTGAADLPDEYCKNAVCAVLSQMNERELDGFSRNAV